MRKELKREGNNSFDVAVAKRQNGNADVVVDECKVREDGVGKENV